MNTTKTDNDICIIGGGFIGHSLIAALASQIKQGLRVSILESSQPTESTGSYSPAFDDRCTAISAGSTRLFKNWNLWPQIQQHATQVNHIEVSEKGRFQTLTMETPNSQDQLGYIIPNQWMGTCLIKNSQALGAACLYNQSVRSINFANDHAEVQLETGKIATSKLVIIADGGRSDLKKNLGIHTDILDFNQIALVTNITTQEAHQNSAFERFSHWGPMAMLPVSGHDQQNTSALVWSVTPEKATELLEMPMLSFLQQGQEQFGTRLGYWKNASKISSYPLSRSFSSEQVRSRLVLLGNSAVSLHPVAGQGLNLGLRAVSGLANTITSQLTENSLGQLSGLLKYQNQIRSDQQQLIHSCDALIKIHDNPIFHYPRSLALGLLDHHLISKSIFTRKAMGLSPEQIFDRKL